MLRTLGVALALSVSAVMLSAGPATAVAAVDRDDRRGDVEVDPSVDGVDPAILDSVDIRHVTVTHQRDGLRVVARLARVLPAHSHWEQELAFTSANSLDDPDHFALVQAFASLQHVGGTHAFLVTAGDSPGTEEGEGDTTDCHVAVTKGAHRVRLDVPERCVPSGDGPVAVVTLLNDKRNFFAASVAVDQFTAGVPAGPLPARFLARP